MKLFADASYPEENFGENQLLDSSMSLSPLFPVRTSDLHVSIESTLHRTFVRLQSDQEKLTVFRVPAIIFKLKSFVSDSRSVPCAAYFRKNTLPWSTRPMRIFAFTTDSLKRSFVHSNPHISAGLLGSCFKTRFTKPF